MAPASSLRLTAVALLALSISANASNTPILRRAEDVLHRPYASVATSSLLNVRDISSGLSTSDTLTKRDGSLNMTAWDQETTAACRAVLTSLHQSTNPSGSCVCYNLPSLDIKTGVFEADLRLFQVNEPRGSFEGISSKDISVGVSYTGASVMAIDPDEVTGQGMVGSYSTVARRSDEPTLLRSYMFIGKIDQNRMVENMTMADFETIIMPTLTLTAKNSSGSTIKTTVSVNEAAFLTGVFSSEVVMSDFAAAQAAVDDQLAGLNNGTVAFVLPGVQILVFPIGLIITSIWLLIGVVVVGFGTYERWNYAEMYRRRQAVAVPRGPRI